MPQLELLKTELSQPRVLILTVLDEHSVRLFYNCLFSSQIIFIIG
uniref:Uncharacterized protein n=1 Tax=Arundo donax TaxID=35708 RepID=A0A0A9H3G4_ARUDO